MTTSSEKNNLSRPSLGFSCAQTLPATVAKDWKRDHYNQPRREFLSIIGRNSFIWSQRWRGVVGVSNRSFLDDDFYSNTTIQRTQRVQDFVSWRVQGTRKATDATNHLLFILFTHGLSTGNQKWATTTTINSLFGVPILGILSNLDTTRVGCHNVPSA